MATSTGVVNEALIFILAFSVLLFFLITFFMILFMVRYRKSRNPAPTELPENHFIEAAWILIPTILVTAMFFYGLTGFIFLRAVPADSIKIKVHARQWSWLFEYDDGKKSPDLVVPFGKNVSCELISADVIHGFYIPAFRIQQDVVPGLKARVWFNATAIGSYYILCSQYCGQKHSAMIAKLYVVPPDQYEAWRKGKNIQLAGAASWATLPRGEALLYERGCMSCHSLSGAPMVGPTLKGLFGSTVLAQSGGQQRQIIADSAYIKKSIIDPGADVVVGFPGTMPKSGEILSDEEIVEITQYLKSLK
jgi:cytochrome c oxidase subunit II